MAISAPCGWHWQDDSVNTTHKKEDDEEVEGLRKIILELTKENAALRDEVDNLTDWIEGQELERMAA